MRLHYEQYKKYTFVILFTATLLSLHVCYNYLSINVSCNKLQKEKKLHHSVDLTRARIRASGCDWK